MLCIMFVCIMCMCGELGCLFAKPNEQAPYGRYNTAAEKAGNYHHIR